MDIAVKVFQIIFYITGSTVAILTFIKAKNGLLNSVNTEYQKKVMERLAGLSDELISEFDFSSDSHWSKNRIFDELVDRITEYALENKEDIKNGKSGFMGVPVAKQQMEMISKLEYIKSDPFIPNSIRTMLVEILQKRIDSAFEVYHEVLSDYQKKLTESDSWWKDFDHNKSYLSSQASMKMHGKGVGVESLQDSVHEIRREIQKYYESFNPIKN